MGVSTDRNPKGGVDIGPLKAPQPVSGILGTPIKIRPDSYSVDAETKKRLVRFFRL